MIPLSDGRNLTIFVTDKGIDVRVSTRSTKAISLNPQQAEEFAAELHRAVKRYRAGRLTDLRPPARIGWSPRPFVCEVCQKRAENRREMRLVDGLWACRDCYARGVSHPPPGGAWFVAQDGRHECPLCGARLVAERVDQHIARDHLPCPTCARHFTTASHGQHVRTCAGNIPRNTP